MVLGSDCEVHVLVNCLCVPALSRRSGDVGSRGSSRVFGCSGAFSSVGFADPENGLVCVIVTNGLIQLVRNEDRLAAVADAVQSAVGSR